MEDLLTLFPTRANQIRATERNFSCKTVPRLARFSTYLPALKSSFLSTLLDLKNTEAEKHYFKELFQKYLVLNNNIKNI